MAEERSDINDDGTGEVLPVIDGDEAATDTPATEEIKEKIEETRNKMGETIDAIQDRLSFSNISDQVSEHVNFAVDTAKDALYEATLGKVREIMKNIGSELSKNSIVNTAKKNPVPFVLMGLGAGLLAYQSYSGSKNPAPGRRRLSGNHEFDNQGADSGSSMLASAGDKVGDIAGKVSDATGSAYEKLSSTAGSVYSGAGGALSQAYSKVGDLGSAARDQYGTYIEENPLAVGAVALALGAAVGMSIPATRYESNLMGDARQEFIDRAQSTATDLLGKAKDKVTEVGQTISDQVSGSSESAAGIA